MWNVHAVVFGREIINDLICVKFHLGDNCIVFENFTASIGDLMVAN
jgi:hypothetical protein